MAPKGPNPTKTDWMLGKVGVMSGGPGLGTRPHLDDACSRPKPKISVGLATNIHPGRTIANKYIE